MKGDKLRLTFALIICALTAWLIVVINQVIELKSYIPSLENEVVTFTSYTDNLITWGYEWQKQKAEEASRALQPSE